MGAGGSTEDRRLRPLTEKTPQYTLSGKWRCYASYTSRASSDGVPRFEQNGQYYVVNRREDWILLARLQPPTDSDAAGADELLLLRRVGRGDNETLDRIAMDYNMTEFCLSQPSVENVDKRLFAWTPPVPLSDAIYYSLDYWNDRDNNPPVDWREIGLLETQRLLNEGLGGNVTLQIVRVTSAPLGGKRARLDAIVDAAARVCERGRQRRRAAKKGE